MNIEDLKPKKRICIYLFGSITNIFILLVSLIFFYITDEVNHLIFTEIIIINLIIILFNLSVLPRTDGYYILMILLDLRNHYIIKKFKFKDEKSKEKKKHKIKTSNSIIYINILFLNIIILTWIILFLNNA